TSSIAPRSASGAGVFSNSIASPRTGREAAGGASGVPATSAESRSAATREVTRSLWENRRPLSEEGNLNSAPRKFRRFVPLLLRPAASPAVGKKKKLTLEDVTAGPPLSGRLVRGVTWLPGSDSFSFVLQKGAGEEIAGDLVLEDANTGARRTIATPENLALPDDPKRRASLEGYRWSPDGKTVVLSGDNDLWFYNVPDKTLNRITRYTPT